MCAVYMYACTYVRARVYVYARCVHPWRSIPSDECPVFLGRSVVDDVARISYPSSRSGQSCCRCCANVPSLSYAFADAGAARRR